MNETSGHEQESSDNNLATVRNRLLTLAGIENYIDSSASEASQESGLEKMISEATLELDAQAMTRFLAFSLAWSKSESDEFFAHTERRLFKSKIEFSQDVPERRGQLADILSYLHLRYKKLKEEKGEDDAETRLVKGDFRAFYAVAVDDLFSEGQYEFIDEVCGFEPGSRQKGEIKVGEEMLGIIREAVSEAGGEDELYDKVLAATEGGYYALMFPYLYNHKGEAKLRRAIEIVLEKRTSDRELTERKIQLLWEVEKFRMSLGIGLDEFNEMFELPGTDELKDGLHTFLKDERLVSEILEGHIGSEAEGVYAQHQKNGEPINFWELLRERAEVKKLPNEADTHEVIEKRRERIEKKIAKYNPLGFEESERAKLFSTTALGAGMGISAAIRPVNIEYTNSDNNSVSIFETDPRDNDLLYARSIGHESGHKTHVNILDRAEKTGLIPEHSWGKIPSSVREIFSGLLEKQAGKLFSGKPEAQETSLEGEMEWVDFLEAYISRRQAVYGLTQIKVRERLQMIWDDGFREADLSGEQIRTIAGELRSSVDEWNKEGVPLSIPLGGAWTNINVLDAYDGTNYLRKYLFAKGEEFGRGKNVDLNVVFSQRFGEAWIKNPDARVVLYSLMIEAATNFDVTSYAKFVKGIDIEEVKSHPVIRKLKK